MEDLSYSLFHLLVISIQEKYRKHTKSSISLDSIGECASTASTSNKDGDQKPKRKVNRSKRAKKGSHGIKVYKNTYVYIGKETSGGWSRDGIPAPKQEVVDRIIMRINTDKDIRKIMKHIKGITIKYAKTINRAGSWNGEKQWFEFVYMSSEV